MSPFCRARHVNIVLSPWCKKKNENKQTHSQLKKGTL